MFMTENEVEELKVFVELSEGLSIDGEDINCFRILLDMYNSRAGVSSLSQDEIDTIRKQLTLMKEAFSQIVLFDMSSFEIVDGLIERLITESIELKN